MPTEMEQARMRLSATFAKIAAEVAACPHCMVRGEMVAKADHSWGGHSVEIEIKALSCRLHARAFLDAMEIR